MIIRTNVNGVWKDVELTKEEVSKAKNDAYKSNLDVIQRLEKKHPEMDKALLAQLASTFTKHVHYHYEELAKEKLAKPVNVNQTTNVDWD